MWQTKLQWRLPATGMRGVGNEGEHDVNTAAGHSFCPLDGTWAKSCTIGFAQQACRHAWPGHTRYPAVAPEYKTLGIDSADHRLNAMRPTA